MSRLVVGPFNRVEGDLEVRLDVGPDGVVEAAHVTAPMYRGFETMLLGRDAMDALVLAPRICGICSLSQSAAAAQALADAMRLEPARNGRIAANLALAVENLADHLTHFYLFFMPDFAHDAYANHGWHADAAARFRAARGSASADVLPARASLLSTLGILVGKWPHTLALQPGGSTRGLETSDKLRLLELLQAFRDTLEDTLFGDRLDAVAALDGAAALERWRAAHAASDFGRFLTIADALRLDELGRGTTALMSVGSYPHADDGRPLFARGVRHDGRIAPIVLDTIEEHTARSWFADDEPRHPDAGRTRPDADKAGGYSWAKAPRLGGRAVETGAFARQMIDGHPLVRDLAQRGGGSHVLARVVARLLELARVLPQMQRWVRELVPGEPFCAHGELPPDGRGAGLVEAARGSLGHWLTVADGRLARYQIIAPTTWNFSPRDADGVPGPLEQALVGTPTRADGRVPRAVQHVVRSFDPCMVCTVH